MLDGLITPGADVRDRWKDAELSTQREGARLLLSPALLGELRIVRAHLDHPGGTPPIHERAVFRKSR